LAVEYSGRGKRVAQLIVVRKVELSPVEKEVLVCRALGLKELPKDNRVSQF